MFDTYSLGGDKRLVITDEGAYVVDMSGFLKDLYAPMPMVMELPPPQPFRIFIDHTPVLRTPMSVVINSFDCGGALPDDGWKFVYLFPLGKRAYVRKK